MMYIVQTFCNAKDLFLFLWAVSDESWLHPISMELHFLKQAIMWVIWFCKCVMYCLYLF